jgi:flagellar hook protein FlgE
MPKDLMQLLTTTLTLSGQQYKAIAMDKDMSHASASDWSLKSGGTAGSNTITVTNGTDDVTLTLASPLQEAIGQTRVTQAVASKDHPVTLMFSDGTTAVKTDGTYEVGTSIPVTTTVGMLQKVLIDSTGTITGVYSNGTRRTEAQVAVAHFNNSPGLFKTGTSLYQESADSGIPTMIQAGEYGVTITPGTLETSNVDLADEFSNMIVTQRGFQSNAKIITVGDEMIETAINTKR